MLRPGTYAFTCFNVTTLETMRRVVPDAPMGYIMGASMALKMLVDQAVQQGEDRDRLKAQAMAYIMAI